MEFQIGKVYVRVLVNIFAGEIAIKVIAPIGAGKMEVTNITIRNDEESPVTFESVEYTKGDRNAQKSAIN